MKVIIDRFEGDYAVCEKEDKTMIDIKKETIPKEASPGDVLIIKDDKTITIDKDETKSREKRIESLMEDMWE